MIRDIIILSLFIGKQMYLNEDTEKILSKRFKIKKLLGKGSFGNVYECEQKKNSQIYAIKIISKTNVKKSKIQCLREQATLLLSLDHENIVKVYQFFEDDKVMFLKMQYVKQGTLGELIKQRQSHSQPFTDDEASQIMGSIFRAVNYIHNLSILHRDIKPENILLNDKKNFDGLKIADFGLGAKVEFRSPTAISKCGTYLFMAPEILWNYTYTKAVDIWSCAIIMYMLKKGQHPFYEQKMTQEEFKDKIKCVVFPRLESGNPESVTDLENRPRAKTNEAVNIARKKVVLAQDLLDRISKLTPNERYAAQDAIKHPWITRNLEDEIPLSLHDSFVGFEISHQFSMMAKTFISIKNIVAKKDSIESSNRKKDILDRYLKHCEEVNKKDRSVSPLKIRRLSSLNTTRELHELCQLSEMSISPKKSKALTTKRQITESNDPNNPTILKLNAIFGSLFNKKEKKPSYGEQFMMVAEERTPKFNEEKHVPDISEYRQRIENELEIAVKQRNKRKRVRILPLRKKDDYGQYVGRPCRVRDYSCLNKSEVHSKSKAYNHPFDEPISINMSKSVGPPETNLSQKAKPKRRTNIMPSTAFSQKYLN